jgi:hypothetical protein
MTIGAANPDTVISPPAIIALGSIVFVLGMIDIAIDIVFSPHVERATSTTNLE